MHQPQCFTLAQMYMSYRASQWYILQEILRLDKQQPTVLPLHFFTSKKKPLNIIIQFQYQKL